MARDNKKIALIVAGLVFALVALAHLLRLIFNADIMISGRVIPMSVSYIGFLIALILSIWMFKAGGKS